MSARHPLRSIARVGQYLSSRERWLALACAAVAAAGAIWGGTLFLRTKTTAIPAPGGTLRAGLVGQPRFVLPILALTNDVDMDLSRLVFNGLLSVAENNRLVGELAESVAVSDDGKTYTAHLRNDVRWHDGELFTADDVLLTVRLIQDPAVKSPLAPAFQGVTVRKLNEQTVQFQLEEPYAPFLQTLTVGILPAHVWADVQPQGIAVSEHTLRPTGTGPLKFERLKRADLSGEVHEVLLTRNERYYKPPALLDGILFRFYPTTDDLARALRRGEVHAAPLLSPHVVREASAMRARVVHRARLPQYFAVFFHQAKSQPLSDPGVRRALAGSVDREQLIREALLDEGHAVETVIPQGAPGHSTDLATVPVNVENARQNLEEAGWKDSDGDGIREKDGIRLGFRLTTTDWPEYVATAKLLAEQWRAVGADVEVRSEPVETMQAGVLRPRDYEALLYGHVLGPEPDPYPFWHSTQTRDPGLNLALFKDRQADRFLETARKTTDADARAAAYRKFEERLIEEVPAIFLYSPTYAHAAPKKLRGEFLASLPHPAERFATVRTWYLKTRRIWKRE